jgi:hypothetical protein
MKERRLPMHMLGVVLMALGACSWARPVTYPIPSGISASFPPSQMKASVEYAKTFCSVLAEPAFAADRWESCDRYVKMPAATPAGTLTAADPSWTLLLIGGFGAQCFVPKVIAFKDAAEHLRDKHSVGFHHLEVDGFGSSERNAEIIRDRVARLTESRFIVVAHSKGAADIMVALTKYPSELQRIKAFITVAGAVGGSYLVDDFAELNEKVLRKLDLPCTAPPVGARSAVANGIDSMRRENRQNFLAATEPHWRGYSIAAVSGKDNTSKILRPLWERLRPYALEQDSHIVERESVVPGGVFLGRALADHWAVAMPFHGNDKVSKEALEVINHNRYPRPALIEAAVLFVIKDLGTRPM